MVAVLPVSAKRTNKGCFYGLKLLFTIIMPADQLTASLSAVKKQENEKNMRDPKVCSGFHLVRGALGFSVLRFWLFFRSVFRFLLQKTSVFRF